MNRLVVKADNASLLIPSLEFEIPSGTQKGSINTLEGFIQLSITDLEQNQSARKARICVCVCVHSLLIGATS